MSSNPNLTSKINRTILYFGTTYIPWCEMDDTTLYWWDLDCNYIVFHYRSDKYNLGTCAGRIPLCVPLSELLH